MYFTPLPHTHAFIQKETYTIHQSEENAADKNAFTEMNQSDCEKGK